MSVDRVLDVSGAASLERLTPSSCGPDGAHDAPTHQNEGDPHDGREAHRHDHRRAEGNRRQDPQCPGGRSRYAADGGGGLRFTSRFGSDHAFLTSNCRAWRVRPVHSAESRYYRFVQARLNFVQARLNQVQVTHEGVKLLARPPEATGRGFMRNGQRLRDLGNREAVDLETHEDGA